MLSLPAQELYTWPMSLGQYTKGHSRWREVLSHPSGRMVWKALGVSVLASWPLVVQKLPGDGFSSKPSKDSISLTKMESKVTTTPKR